MGSYVFKWPYPAKDVHVTGTFDDWAKSVEMEKVGDEWIKEVDLPSADETIYYKFVVDDIWKVDANLPTEGDGHYNTNNVLYPQDIKRKGDYGVTGASDVPGAFPETPANDNQTFSVQPIPATGTGKNPITVAPGAPLPRQKDITSNTIDSNVTTSKEDYEKAGDSVPVPAEPTFSVNPIPATTGASVTTSKEAYETAAGTDPSDLPTESEFSVKPIPASGGIGNPISLPAGESIPDQKDITSNTIGSTVTTSKEDYDNAGSGISGYAAAGAAAVGGLGVAGLASAHSGREKKSIIPESGLPMGAGAASGLAPSPFISSLGPGATTADLAAKVPMEDTATRKLASDLEIPLKQSPFISSIGPGTTTSELASKVPLESGPTIRSSGPGTTTSALAAAVPLESTKTTAEPLTSSGVPEVVKESISAAHETPEAAASSEAVKEKADLEKELLSKTQPTDATGESAGAAGGQTSYYGLATTVPPTVEKSMEKAHVAPEAAAETSAVAEKSAVERELLSKVPSTDEAGEPAPTIAAATSTTVPTTTSATAAATSITDGKTANEPIPDTDTSSAARGPSAGELAGGAAIGGAAAAGATALAARHHNADVEPPRVADSTKPDITTEASPATAITAHIPGQSTSAAAAVSDGADTSRAVLPKESTEAATTEYAPVRTGAAAPGVSSTAAAALSDGTEDPTLTEDVPGLANEPAVKLMNQSEGAESASTPIGQQAPVTTTTPGTTTAPVSTKTPTAGEGSTLGNKEPSALVGASGVPTLTSAGTDTSKLAGQKDVVSAGSQAPSAPTTPAKQRPQSMAASSPATSTATSTGTDKKKKRHRLSALIHKIFD